tara:strand:- start:492 stop:1151 length:660 start_codon:yes stop_codon:yes gene_type:complete
MTADLSLPPPGPPDWSDAFDDDFDGYADILDACCRAWNFFADDKDTVASITGRQWAAGKSYGGWYNRPYFQPTTPYALKSHAGEIHWRRDIGAPSTRCRMIQVISVRFRLQGVPGGPTPLDRAAVKGLLPRDACLGALSPTELAARTFCRNGQASAWMTSFSLTISTGLASAQVFRHAPDVLSDATAFCEMIRDRHFNRHVAHDVMQQPDKQAAHEGGK